MTPQEFWMVINHRIKKAAPKEQPMTRERMLEMAALDKMGRLKRTPRETPCPQ